VLLLPFVNSGVSKGSRGNFVNKLDKKPTRGDINLNIEKLKENRRKVVVLVLIVSVLGAGAIAGYYYYNSVNYIITEDARVSADTVTIVPETTGRLLEWNAEESDRVESGQLLGRLDLTPSLASLASDPESLQKAGSIMAQKAEIRAPISGEIIQSKAVVGSLVGPSTALAVVADTDHAYISANIKETKIGRVKVGQKVQVKIDAYPNKVFYGRVASIGKATTSTFSLLPSQNSGENYIKVTQVIPVKIVLTEGDNKGLMPGMNATVKIYLKS